MNPGHPQPRSRPVSPSWSKATLSQTSQLEALPDGTFRLTSSIESVKVQQDGQWVPVDTTYPDVMPGVDLQVAVSAAGYQQTLIVRDEQAAANPDLQSIEVGVHSSGIDLRQSSDGSLDAVAADGAVILAGAQPVMCDSSHDPAVGPAPTATEAGGSSIAAIEQSVDDIVRDGSGATTTATVTLEPPADALIGDDVQYPVFIDPPFGNASASVEMTGGGTKFVVPGPLTGPRGQAWNATSAWGVDVDGTVRLITATP